ncbi:hypothetical protein [Stieleria marina]|uniref:Uncharacterized protein n=1 Tax=Stieleria marina TaxID=1930275 RepID=A0A517NPR3_9BACT|nr:hypothetical protein K239x_10450 [Planctomycetes bacterium K23_9]
MSNEAPKTTTKAITPTRRFERPLRLWLLLAICVAAYFLCSSASAADPSDFLPPDQQHALYSADMPAGVVGRARLTRRGPVANYYQPVKFVGPEGTMFALPQGAAISRGEPNLMAGLLIGGVYRFRVTGIPNAEGAELYPTVELIDRMYPPDGLATSYPIVLKIDEIDMQAALDGKLVTRVVYLEDPQTAIPLVQTDRQANVMDIGEHQDALGVADHFGRAVAIIRIGSLAPPRAPSLMPEFYFGYPSWAPIFQPENDQPTAVEYQ